MKRALVVVAVLTILCLQFGGLATYADGRAFGSVANPDAAVSGNTAVTIGGNTPVRDTTIALGSVPVQSVSLNKSQLSLPWGDRVQLIATVRPSNATNKRVSWVSSNPWAAAVDGSGMVSARIAGAATITVTTEDGRKKATCQVIVAAPLISVAVTGVKMDRSGVRIGVGSRLQLSATVSPRNATDKRVTWVSSNKAVATVSTSGLVTGVSEGPAVIVVTTVDGGFTARSDVYIAVLVTGVSLRPSTLTLAPGATATLAAKVLPANATIQTVTWASSAPLIVSVSNGVITARGTGTAKVTVETKDGRYTATCVVTVAPLTTQGSWYCRKDGLWVREAIAAGSSMYQLQYGDKVTVYGPPSAKVDGFAWVQLEPYGKKRGWVQYDAVARGLYAWPVPAYGQIGKYGEWGPRVPMLIDGEWTSDFHTGIDIPAGENSKVVAAASGIVDTKTFSVLGGNYILIRNDDGYYAYYGHLNGFKAGLAKGQHVTQGEVIGYVGETGKLCRGFHLHFGVSTTRDHAERRYSLNPREFVEEH